MPIALATMFPTAVPTLPGAGAPVVSAGFGQAVDGVIGARSDVLPPAFAAPWPEDTAVLLATAQAALAVAVGPAEGQAELALAAPPVMDGRLVQSDGVPASPVIAAPVTAAAALAEVVLPLTDAAATTLPVSTAVSEPERGAAAPQLPAPTRPATKAADTAEVPVVAIAPPAAAPIAGPPVDATAIAQVAAPVLVADEAPADDKGANDNPPPEERASAPAPAPTLLAALPPTTVPAAPVAAPKAARTPDAGAVSAPSKSASFAAADPASNVAGRLGEPVSADPQDGFAERLAAQAPAVAVRAPASDAAPTPALAQPGAPVQQAIAPLATTAATPAATPPAAISTHQPHVAAQAGRIGREMGVAIARRVVEGGHELTVRLNPAELGRIEVKMGFSDQGTLRATVAAESAVALDLLRRDSADLGRALADAGVRADAQSFRFDTRSGDGGGAWQRQAGQGGQGGHNGHQGQPAYPGGRGYPAELPDGEPVYRALRTSGRVDLMA